ncbi:MAG: hydrogenase maturation nickel metallochaperone HypA [Desulfovibrio sp.]
MHEASLVRGLLQVALDELEKYNRQHQGQKARIKKISCELGLMSCVEEVTLKACFELFAEGTLAENADLELARLPLACQCAACGHSFEMKRREFFCPRCGDTNIRFSGGHGLAMVGLAVECEDNGK